MIVPAPQPSPPPKTPKEVRADAIREFERALKESPDNISAALRLAGLLERGDEYHRAIAIYLRSYERWPRVYEPQYRLAATLGMSDAWAPRGPTSQADRLALQSLPGRRQWPELASELLRPDEHVVRNNLERAAEAWSDLRHFVGVLPSLTRWIGATARRKRRREDRDAAYQRRFVGFSRGARCERATVSLARYAVEVQMLRCAPEPLVPEEPPGLDRIRHRLDRRLRGVAASSSTCLYNAACCYSRVYELSGRSDDCRRALDLLQRAIDADDDRRILAILFDDPDLASLRRSRSFGRWEWFVRSNGLQNEAMRWMSQLASAMAGWWELWGGVVQDPQSRPLWQEADDRLFEGFLDWGDPRRDGEGHRVRPADRVLQAAEELHVRLDDPPPGQPVRSDEWEVLTGHVGAGGVGFLSQAPREPKARLLRWRTVQSAVAELTTRRGDAPRPGEG